MFGIYVHIPFCVAKCNYCSFVSKCANEKQIDEYVNALCSEIKLSAKKYNNHLITSIYFGGGTPSFINEKHIKTILTIIKQNYNVEKTAEISIECNPCSTDFQKLKTYKQIGINRLSFGVQSLNNNELNVLGRKHNNNMAKEAINQAKELGFNNISADVMIGIPFQTKESLLKTLNELINLNITHISAYMLMLEEGTRIYEMVKKNKLQVASDDECVSLYNTAVRILEKNGLNRYEISNFSKNNFECKHNLNYWQMGEYVGFGLASHSFVNGKRFNNYENFEEYYKYVNALKNGEDVTRCMNIEHLTKKQQIEETIMLGLRTKNGVSINILKNLDYDILNEKKEIIKELKQNKIIKIRNKHIILTEKSFGLCSAVVLELIN